MSGRSRDTFKKRQKEVARAEKRQEKAARRMRRHSEPKESSGIEHIRLGPQPAAPENEDERQPG